jgi:hypothetical protein
MGDIAMTKWRDVVASIASEMEAGAPKVEYGPAMLEAGTNAFFGRANDERGFALAIAATRIDPLLAGA